MRLPTSPPKFDESMAEILKEGPERFSELTQSGINRFPIGKYPHWDELRYRKPPGGFTVKEWWWSKKFARLGTSRPLPFKDKHGKNFFYTLPDSILQMSSAIDRDASGQIRVPDLVTSINTRDTYLVNSLIEEAITSSQLEGASTTRKVAKDMLRRGRNPRTKSEQMIFNNYKAMQYIRDISQEDLTPELILELQRIVTDGTLDDLSGAGRWRMASEDVKVVDARDDTVLHVPPDASEIPERVVLLCEFANGKFEETFIHPVWRAILLHMMLGYDHPFIDGNGRTARALFYWSMARQGYWLTEFVTISKILRNAPAQYARAYLFVTSDDNDTTYFIHYHLRILIRAIQSLYEYLGNKINEIRETEDLIRQSDALMNMMNPRQLALVTHALKHPGTTYEIEAHRKSHNITYETARTDLLALEKFGILSKGRRGRAYIFTAPSDLHGRLEALSVPEARRAPSRHRRRVGS